VVPAGLEWNGEPFGAVTTGWFYSLLQQEWAIEEGLVDLAGIEPATS
jgi:hypothetical protein